jgi:hypothetical protein
VLDPQPRGRQYLAAQLEKLTGARVAGFILMRQRPAGRWGAATYALKKTGEGERLGAAPKGWRGAISAHARKRNVPGAGEA